MKQKFRLIKSNRLTILLFMLASFALKAQNVIVTGALVGNGSYPTLGDAFTAINGGAQTGALIGVQIVANTTEPFSAVLNAGTWLGLGIQPSTSVTVTGNFDGAVVDLVGASNVGINGNNLLTISNTNSAGFSPTVIRFINDASNNQVLGCTLLGSTTGTNTGVVTFANGIATGNDNNTISNNTIGAAGSNLPRYGIFSSGALGFENSGNTISNNSISDFFNATSVSNGINLASNNSDWTITGNKLFQTGTRLYTTANTHSGILIAGGNNYTISNNVIGYATPNATGTYSMTGTIATRFIGINLSAGTLTASTVQGNTVTAISLNTSSGATTTNGILCGINVTAGNVNITSNILGGIFGIDLLKGTSTTTGGLVNGINCSSTGAISIQTNTIGGLSSSGITATIAGGISGINISGTASNLSINGNTIGNATANNMRGGTLGLTTGNSNVSGINLPSTSIGIIVISNNTIQNLASYGTGTTGFVRGIWTAGATGNINTYSITANVISNLTSNNSLTSIANGQAAALGINVGAGTNGVVSSNTITNVALTGTATTGNFVAGITAGNATSTKFLNNKIYNITNAGTSVSLTTPNIAAGIIIRSGTTDVTIANNFISLGNGQTTNTSFIGIMGNHGSTPDPIDKIYFNTINIEGVAATGAIPSFGFLRGDLSVNARTATIDFKNNIITNTRSGGTGQHFAIANNFGATASATGWSVNASNNNILNANASTIGYWTSSQTFAGWQTTSACDANSFSGIAVTYVNSANDLHLNMGVTPTLIESGAQPIAGITTDIDNQNRPGPSGSVNGGGFAPDMGADEIDAVFLDVSAPVITYTTLPFTCNTNDRNLTATITDLSGVPTTGALQPRIYFRKNAGAWFSSQGTLASGTATNGTWNFNISSATMGGLIITDVVSYFVIAQDVLAYVSSNPLTGLVASDVNTVSTPPATPSAYPISGTLSGLYTVGATGTYSTITAAANAYNTSCLSGAIEFSLIDGTYPSETYPITFLSNVDASPINKLTIKPATSVTATIAGSSATSVIYINGGDYITINGSNGTVANSICPLVKATRDLTITNTNAATTSAIISMQTSAAGNGATNNGVINTNLVGNGSLTTLVGVNIGGTAIGSGAGAVNNDNNSIINNSIQSVQFGIYSTGQTPSIKNTNNQFDLNDLNGTGLLALGKGGIAVVFEDQTKIRSNSIANIISTSGTFDVHGITLGTIGLANTLTTGSEVTNAVITGNDIKNIVQSNTYSSGGIILAATSTGTTLITNNMIDGVFAKGTAGDFGCGIYYGGGAGVLNVYHNSVNVAGATLTGASQPNIAIAINGVTPNVNMKNNIFMCSGDNGFAGNTGVGLSYTSTVGNYANLISSNNDIFVSGTSSSVGRVGSLTAGTQKITLLDWQTETGKDLNSVSINPTFVSANDLHLVANSNAGIENAGTPLSLVTSDIDCNARSLTAPDIGADEVCTNPTLATAATSNTLVCAGTTVTLTATGTLNDANSWNWYSSSCGGTAVGTGTAVTVTPTNITDYFVRAEGGCVTPALCASVTVNTNALPTLTVNSGAICAGNSFTMIPSGASTYTFSNGSNVIAVTGDYTVTGTDANGCVSALGAISSVTVNALPTLTVNSGAICAGNSFTMTPSGASTYTFSNGSDVVAIAGDYTVTGTDANGCISSTGAVSSVTVDVLPSITVNSGAICAGNSFTIIPSGASTYTYSNGSNIVSVAGDYTVTGTGINGCVNSTGAVSSVTVNALPSIMAMTNNTLLCTGETATLSAMGATTYTWSTSENSINITVSPTTTTVYTLTGTDANGCSNSTTLQQDVNLCTGINNVNGLLSRVEVYPNPSNGLFTIELANDSKVIITNTLGQDFVNSNYTSGKHNIVLNEANGVYFVKIITENSQITKRLVINK